MWRRVHGKRHLLGLGAVVLTVLLASCGTQATFTVTLGSSGGTVIRGDSVSVPVTVSNASGSVNLSVSGAPSGVTASLASATLSGGATSTTLDVQVSAAASDGSVTLTVNAVNGSNASSATYALTVSSLSVHGTVVDLLENGVAGVTVAIQGTTATTDSSGSFTIGGVSVPYDAIVKQTVTSTDVAQVFEGLTSATPELNPYATVVGPSVLPMGATISGNLSAAVATGYEAMVCAQTTSTWMTGCVTVSAGSTAYSFTVNWQAGTSVPVTVYAIEVATDSDGFATGYNRYGTATGSLSNGGTPTINVSWGSTPSVSNLMGSVNLPAGFYLGEAIGGADLTGSTTLPLFYASGTSGSPLPTSFTAAVPQIGASGNTLLVAGYPATGSGASIAWQQDVSAGSVTLSLPTPPTQTAPADGATGIGVGSTLSLSSLSGAATFLISGPSQAVIITTTNASTTIPDLSSVGMSLASATSYDWQAIVTPTATTPEAAALNWIRDYFLVWNAVQNGGTRTSLTSGSIMSTTSRSFVTP